MHGCAGVGGRRQDAAAGAEDDREGNLGVVRHEAREDQHAGDGHDDVRRPQQRVTRHAPVHQPAADEVAEDVRAHHQRREERSGDGPSALRLDQECGQPGGDREPLNGEEQERPAIKPQRADRQRRPHARPIEPCVSVATRLLGPAPPRRSDRREHRRNQRCPGAEPPEAAPAQRLGEEWRHHHGERHSARHVAAPDAEREVPVLGPRRVEGDLGRGGHDGGEADAFEDADCEQHGGAGGEPAGDAAQDENEDAGEQERAGADAPPGHPGQHAEARAEREEDGGEPAGSDPVERKLVRNQPDRRRHLADGVADDDAREDRDRDDPPPGTRHAGGGHTLCCDAAFPRAARVVQSG